MTKTIRRTVIVEIIIIIMMLMKIKIGNRMKILKRSCLLKREKRSESHVLLERKSLCELCAKMKVPSTKQQFHKFLHK